MTRLAALVTHRSRRVLLIAGLFFAVAGVLGAPIAGQLKARESDFQDRSAPNMVAAKQLQRATGEENPLGLVALVHTHTDVRTDPRAMAKVRRVAAVIAADRGIERVVTPRGPRDPLISSTGRETVVPASFRGDDTVKRLRARLAGHNVQFGGRDVVFHELGHRVSHDLGKAEMLAFPLLFLLSLWIFRGMIAALLPPLVGALSIVTTFLALRFVNGSVTSLSIFAINLVTGVGLGLAIDYSLFIVSRWREEAEEHGFGLEAMRRTLSTAGRTVLFSSLTVAAALASMLLFPLRFLYSMGIGGTICALVAGTVALTVLPAVLVALGPRINSLAPGRWRRAAHATARPAQSGGWYRLAHGVMRRPVVVAVASAAVLIVAGLPFLRVTFVPADFKMLPAGSESRVVSEAIERDFPNDRSQPIEAIVRAPHTARTAVANYRNRLAAVPGTAVVTPPRRLGRGTWEIDVYGRGDPVSAANQDLVRRVRDVPAKLEVHIGGRTAAFIDQQAALTSHLPAALALIVVTTFAVLFLMTGSVILPLKALLMNVLTLSAAFGGLVLVFQDGRLESLLSFKSAGGLEATQPVLLFAIAFGLATDYGVFLLSRIKEARDAGIENREAVAFGVERTGRIVTAAALLFCVAIGAFATSGVEFIKVLGLGTAAAVALDATIVRALLVPALMVLLGRWNWWAPRPLRRLHARIGLREGDVTGAAA